MNVPIDAIPLHVRQAFLATEDRRFYEHNGLDWRGLFRAVATNVRHLGVREGFSTITMQVARNSFLVKMRCGRTLRRKLIELRLTRLIEGELTKDQILELYLNLIYLGNGMNGVEAASRDLFGKSVSKLSIDEGAVLAALPKGPSAYTPRDHPDRALRRRNLVLVADGAGGLPHAGRSVVRGGASVSSSPRTSGAPTRGTSRSRSTRSASSSTRSFPTRCRKAT